MPAVAGVAHQRFDADTDAAAAAAAAAAADATAAAATTALGRRNASSEPEDAGNGRASTAAAAAAAAAGGTDAVAAPSTSASGAGHRRTGLRRRLRVPRKRRRRRRRRGGAGESAEAAGAATGAGLTRWPPETDAAHEAESRTRRGHRRRQQVRWFYLVLPGVAPVPALLEMSRGSFPDEAGWGSLGCRKIFTRESCSNFSLQSFLLQRWNVGWDGVHGREWYRRGGFWRERDALGIWFHRV